MKILDHILGQELAETVFIYVLESLLVKGQKILNLRLKNAITFQWINGFANKKKALSMHTCRVLL